MRIEFRKHIPGCPGEYCEPVAIGVCHADIYSGYLRLRCLLKEELVRIDNPLGEEEYNDTKTCVMLSPGDLIKCGSDVICLYSVEQMSKIAETMNRQLPAYESFKKYPNKNTLQYDSDIDLYD